MDREQKYIIDDYGNFVIFSKLFTHADVARARGLGAEKIVGAGFLNMAIGYKNPSEYNLGEENTFISVHCYGESFSLGIKAREKEDSEAITNTLNGFNEY